MRQYRLYDPELELTRMQAGMIDSENIDRRKRKNAWAGRYDERNLESAHIGQSLEEGEEGDNYVPQSEAERQRLERRRNEGLWGDHDEEYYNDGMCACWRCVVMGFN